MAWLPPRCCSSRGCWLPHHQRQRTVVFGRRWLRGPLLLFIAHVMLVGVLCVVVVECSMLCVDCGDAVVPAASGAARGMYSMEPWPWSEAAQCGLWATLAPWFSPSLHFPRHAR